ncbi:MAG: conjugal transfer protein TraB, partial [Erythrobacter sp.]|nr:conjugal transfer protein TraB [Erythrobacter sp.]
MADTDRHDTPAAAPKDETRGEARRNLNRTVAQRQKLLLAGIGGVALISGSMFIFGGEDEAGADGAGATTIETGALVNRNLSQREFVATYGNRLDAQGKAIKDLQETQLPRASIEQELETLRGENARMLSDGQAAIDAISAENAALRSALETVRANPPVAPVASADPRAPGINPGPLEPPSEPKASLLSFSSEKPGAAKTKAIESAPTLLLEASRDYLPPNSYAP